MVVEHSDEGDEEDVEEQPHLQEVEARARSAEHEHRRDRLSRNPTRRRNRYAPNWTPVFVDRCSLYLPRPGSTRVKGRLGSGGRPNA